MTFAGAAVAFVASTGCGSGAGTAPSGYGTSVADAGSGGTSYADGSTLGPGSDTTTGGSSGAVCAAISSTATAKLLPVDVVWAIDTSGSMSGSFPAIQKGLNDFSAKMDAAGIDVHVVLLAGQGLCVPAPLGSGSCGAGGIGGIGIGATSPPATAPDTRMPRFLHLDVPFGYSFGMAVLLDQHPNYRSMLRTAARTHLVLTEDGPPPMSPDAVVEHIEGRASATLTPAWNPGLTPGSWVFSGVVCAHGATAPQCFAARAIPQTTLTLISRTGGVLLDLAEVSQGTDPFGKLLQELAAKAIVGAELSCDYDIPTTPGGQSFDRDRVNVTFAVPGGQPELVPRTNAACGQSLAWIYDDPLVPTKIILCPTACERVRASAGTKVDVQFGCATQMVR